MIKKSAAVLISAVLLLLSGCGKTELIFLYDSHLESAFHIDVPLFAGSYDGTLPETFEKLAASRGYRLKGICLEKEKEYAAAVKEYSSSQVPVIMTAYIFTDPEVMKSGTENCIAVGPASDIPYGTEIAGKGLDSITAFGRETGSAGRNVSFVRYDNNLGNHIYRAFVRGYGNENGIEEIRASSVSAVTGILEKGRGEAVVTAGKYLTDAGSVRKGADRMILLNNPVNPDLFSDREKERIKEAFSYDFRAAFETALEKVSSGTAGKNVYCLELSRIFVPMP